MSGTIRSNGQNSAREVKRAEIQRNRRAAQRERYETRAMDDRALHARIGR